MASQLLVALETTPAESLKEVDLERAALLLKGWLTLDDKMLARLRAVASKNHPPPATNASVPEGLITAMEDVQCFIGQSGSLLDFVMDGSSWSLEKVKEQVLSHGQKNLGSRWATLSTQFTSWQKSVGGTHDLRDDLKQIARECEKLIMAGKTLLAMQSGPLAAFRFLSLIVNQMKCEDNIQYDVTNIM